MAELVSFNNEDVVKKIVNCHLCFFSGPVSVPGI